MQRIHSSDLHPPHRRHRSYSVGVAGLVVRYLPQVGGIRMGTHRLRTWPTPRAGYDQEAVVPKRTARGPGPGHGRRAPLPSPGSAPRPTVGGCSSRGGAGGAHGAAPPPLRPPRRASAVVAAAVGGGGPRPARATRKAAPPASPPPAPPPPAPTPGRRAHS